MGVLQYVAKRLGLYFAVLFIGLTITFFLPRLMPANPIDGYIGQLQPRAKAALTPEAIAELRENLEELYGLKGDLFTPVLRLSRSASSSTSISARRSPFYPAAGLAR